MSNPFEIIDQRLLSIEGALLDIKLTKQPEESTDSKRYIALSKAEQILGVSRPTLYEFFKDGRLTKYKLGGMTRVLLSEVLALVEPATV